MTPKSKLLQRAVVLFICLNWIFVGCSGSDRSDLSPMASNPSPPEQSFMLGVADSTQMVQGPKGNDELGSALSSAVYASSLETIGPWYKTEWLVVFYLPYNPGIANFQGRAPWGWQTFSGSYATIWDAKYVQGRFRVRVLVGLRVTGLCSLYPGNYRMVF